MRLRRLGLATLLWLAASASGAATPADPGAWSLVAAPPKVCLRGLPCEVELALRGAVPEGLLPLRLEIRDANLELVTSTRLDDASGVTVELPTDRPDHEYRVIAPEASRESVFRLRTIPGWSSLIPPLLAIGFALRFRHVVLALIVGVWAGAWLFFGGPVVGLQRALDHYVVNALADSDHVSIIVFSLLLGGMVGIVSRSGGTSGLVEALRPWATSRRRGQLVTWLMGIVIFFDDYANTLLVGNTMRPVTDRLRISREKLAYIVDSTAAPVASIALVSTWIGYEVSLIGDSLKQIGSELDAYTVFLRAIPYNFYPILALAFGLLIASSRRDFGPMRVAEQRAAAGRVLDDGAAPLADFDGDALLPAGEGPHRWFNAAAPILTVLLVTFVGLWLTGRASLSADGDPMGETSPWRLGIEGIGAVFGAGASYKTLLWGSAAGCGVALLLARTQGILDLGEGIRAWLTGIRSMTLAIVILTLAWSISSVCSDLNTSGFLVGSVADWIDARWLPAIIFILAGLTAFATGTSWTTMGILIPLAVPLAHGVTATTGIDAAAAQAILLGSVSAVLAGAIFGDHCSPISDTTVMSSMASGCDHIDHVRTQLPYAIVVGVVATLFGYVPAGFGWSPWICLPSATVVLVAIVVVFGRTGGTEKERREGLAPAS